MKLDRIYAEALSKNAQKASDVDALVAHLKERGRLKLLPGILRELKQMEERRKQQAPLLEVANEGEASQAKREAADHGIAAEQVRINHALIRGWRARAHGMLVDRSGKRALVDLYRQITK